MQGCDQLAWTQLPTQYDAAFDIEHVEVASFEEGAKVTRVFENGYFCRMETFKFDPSK